MTVRTCLSTCAVATLAAATSSANADISLDFTNFTASGASLYPTDYATLTGSLDSIFGDFTLVQDGQGYTWADDLTVLIANEDFSDILVQAGGFSDFGATYRGEWEFGASGNAGTMSGGTISFGTSIDVTGYYLYLGNGYVSGGFGVWTGSVDLFGSIDYAGSTPAVPGPAGLAGLVGIADIARRRRRG